MTYWEGGEGSTPLLFLHGAGATIQTYKYTLEKLTKKYHVIAPDLPCFGESDVPKQVWDFGDYAQYFDGFIKAKKLTNAVVLGHSFGGGIGLYLAAINHTIKHLVVVNPAGYPVERSTLHQCYLFFVKKTVAELYEEKEVNTLGLMSKQFSRNLKLHFRELPQIFRIIKKCLWDKNISFEKIKAPTTILWGKKDVVFPVSYAEALQRAIPGAKLILVDGAHSWALFNPSLFYTLFKESMV